MPDFVLLDLMIYRNRALKPSPLGLGYKALNIL